MAWKKQKSGLLSEEAWLGFATTFFISFIPLHLICSKGLWDVLDVLWWLQNHSLTWFDPGLEILEVSDVLLWRWSYSVTEGNANNAMLSVNKGVK
ncbi:hypothetical protein OUZ56_029278 [Daphnia magna]|uniref:Uncharacterized protein n=1 Tax=Daphnia magna TaxID=35525 RepID=A0ABR0B6C6_9CRUS|nr:hypothetical protein OUZ56_029278 [Daphnia magna]